MPSASVFADSPAVRGDHAHVHLPQAAMAQARARWLRRNGAVVLLHPVRGKALRDPRNRATWRRALWLKARMTMAFNLSLLRIAMTSTLLLCLGWSGWSHAQSGNTGWQYKPVRLVADDWCPQHCESGHAEKGYVVDIVSQALAMEGIPFTLQYMPWARAMNMVTRGEADGLLTPTVPGFPQFIYHDKAVGYQQYCFYVDAASDWKYNRFADLRGKRLAYLKDSGFGPLEEYLNANKSSIPTTEMTGDKDFAKRLFAFLGFKRADAVVVTTDVFAYGQAKGDIAKGFKQAGCLAQEKMAVGLSPANATRSRAIGQALDQGIAKLRGNGGLKKILDRYGMQVWP